MSDAHRQQAVTAVGGQATSAHVDTARRPRPVARVLLTLINFYRLAISPALAPSCRYLPSCSAYAAEAISVHGAGRGSWLALRRLLRCHPFHAGGHDPVPLPVARMTAVPPAATDGRSAAVRRPVRPTA